MRNTRRRRSRLTAPADIDVRAGRGAGVGAGSPRRTGRVQARYVALRALIEGDTLCLGSPGDGATGPDGRYCAVLAVGSVNFGLRSAEEQEAIIAGFSAWLNALSFDVQILVRVVPLSLEPYLRRPLRSLDELRTAEAATAQECAGSRDDVPDLAAPAGTGGRSLASSGASAERTSGRGAWIELIADHVRFVRELARQRRLLDRHFYLIVPGDPPVRERDGTGLPGWLAALGRLARAGRRPGLLRRQGGSPDALGLTDRAARTWQRQDAARHQLDLRTTEVVRQLGRMGLTARRLRGRELVQLYYSCLTPGRAVRHPISEQVIAGAGLPVLAGTTRERTTGGGADGDVRADGSDGPAAADGTGRLPDVPAVAGSAIEHAPASAGPRAHVAGGSNAIPAHPAADDGEAGTSAESHAHVAGAADVPARGIRWPLRGQRRSRRPRRLQDGPQGDLCIGLGDLLAPAAVEVARDHLCLEGEYARVLAVTGYPRRVYPGWLGRLIDADVPLEAVLHIHPRDARAAILRLRKRLVEFQSSRALDQKAGKLPDTEREIAFRDIEQLQEQLQRGDTRVFDLSLYVLVRGASADLLDQRTEQVQMALDNLLLIGRPVPYEQDVAFTSCLPEAHDRLRRGRLLDTGSVATAFPFSSSTLSMNAGILYGTVPRNGSLIILDPFSPELENANAVVFAQSGAGKSYACKLQALRALAGGVAVTIVDPEDEYRRLCRAVGGQYVRLSPSSTQRLNPFDLFAPSAPVPAAAPASPDPTGGTVPEEDDGGWDPLAEKIQALHTLLDLMLADHGPGLPGSLTQREKGLLDRALYETYRRAGITPDPTTHGRPAPLLRDLYGVLRAEDLREQDVTGLADRLHRWVEGSLARMFSAPTNVRLDSPFVAFSIRDMDAELKPIGLALIADSVWTRMRRDRGRLPRLFFLDEAWTLMQFPEGGRFLSALARRARKYHLGLVTITQDVQDFLGSEWGQTVLAQSAIKLLMKQDPSTSDGVGHVFHLSQGERQFLLGCNKGEGLLFARGAHVALRVEASPAEHALATTNPREVAAIEARAAAARAGAATGAARLTGAAWATPPGLEGAWGDLSGDPREG